MSEFALSPTPNVPDAEVVTTVDKNGDDATWSYTFSDTYPLVVIDLFGLSQDSGGDANVELQISGFTSAAYESRMSSGLTVSGADHIRLATNLGQRGFTANALNGRLLIFGNPTGDGGVMFAFDGAADGTTDVLNNGALTNTLETIDSVTIRTTAGSLYMEADVYGGVRA